uniref:carboxylesterase n=1 Tax=Glossina brevipalpis TaxID=37001 RepID=A0A1A9W1E2_9MUSC
MAEELLVVNTTLGPVKGQQCTGVYDDVYYSFEKIPFAEKPLGSLRFHPPVAKKPWTELLDCTEKPPKPMQKNLLTQQIEGNEDCLYINLKTSKPLPVIVFLFGGGFERGDPSRDLHGPDYFMMKSVILITLSYRLGPFGFLSFKDPSLGIPGNTGLKDQLLALQWIKANVHHFNGDSDNVTLAGESAGAASAHYLMCCPLARGLFHKAILMSGTVLCSWAYSPLKNIPLRLAKTLGYEGADEDEKSILEFLQQQPGENLLKPYLNSKEENMNDFLFTYGPSIETYRTETCIIDKYPEELLAEPWGNEIPILVSGTSFEGLMMYGRVHLAPFLINELEDNPQHLLPFALKENYSISLQKDLAKRIKKLHFGDKPFGLESILYYCEYASYKVIWHPILRSLHARLNCKSKKAVATSATSVGADSYLYRFDFDSPHFNHQRIKYCGKQLRGVAHVDDHSYLFFGNFSSKLSTETPEYKTIKRMIDIWTSFAQCSRPFCCTDNVKNGDEITQSWLPVAIDESNANGTIKCLNIANQLELIDLPEMAKLQTWESLYQNVK